MVSHRVAMTAPPARACVTVQPMALQQTAVSLREVTHADVDAMTEMMARNRADIERVGPANSDGFFTAAGMTRRIDEVIDESARGQRRYWTIRVDGALAGDISISHIQRGALQNANLGYLVDVAFRGHGVATAAVRLAVEQAFGEVGLHRLEAGVMPSNVASQRVLERAGFTRVGITRSLLYIAGRWEDHILYELVGPDGAPAMTSAAAPSAPEPRGGSSD
jgi:ribosomal-protein-alanine N-acetyltransferase